MVFALIYIVESRGDTSGHYLLLLSVEVFYVKVDDRPVNCMLSISCTSFGTRRVRV